MSDVKMAHKASVSHIDDATNKMLAAFSRKWTDGPDVNKRITKFAKHNGITKANAVWLILCYSTACMGEDGFTVDGSMDEYMSEWHRLEREEKARLDRLFGGR